MPDRGLRKPTETADVSFGTGRPLALESARWLQITFEVEKQSALEAMPCEVGRPIPPYARLLVAEAGGRRLALLSVGGRYQMMPRNVVVASVSDGFGEQLAATFGTGASPGSISLEREGEVVRATVNNDDGLLATVTLPKIYAIEPSMLRWDGIVAMAREDGSPVIAELAPTATIGAAFLSKGAELETPSGLARGHQWRRLRSIGTISACYAEGTLDFGAPAVRQAWT
jgi:hypothetical protein